MMDVDQASARTTLILSYHAGLRAFERVLPTRFQQDADWLLNAWGYVARNHYWMRDWSNAYMASLTAIPGFYPQDRWSES